MVKKINRELKRLIESQINIEGFDYAMTEKINLDDWGEGVVPSDLKDAYDKYLACREELKETLRKYRIDPQ